MAKYVKRDLEPLLKKAFKQFPALILTGARQTGKSTLIQHLFPKLDYLSLDKLNIRNYAKSDPEGFLNEYDLPIIIDEIQEVPSLLSYVKSIIDKNRKPGMFIITGSQQFSLMEGVQESLAGRAAILDLTTFSFNEVKEKIKHKSWYECTYRGFYPEIWTERNIERDLWYSSYLRTFVDRDVSKHLKEENLFNYSRFIELLAARCSQELNFLDLSKELGLDRKTVQTWISFLVRSQVIFLIPPYFKNLGKRVTKKQKMYFFDTGLVASLTRYHEPGLIKNGPMSGALFENLIMSEAMKQNFAKANRKNLFYYKENNGLEIDLIIDDPIKPKIFEIKSTSTPNEKHLKNLLKFQDLMDLEIESSLISSSKEEFTFKGIKHKNFLNFKI